MLLNHRWRGPALYGLLILLLTLSPPTVHSQPVGKPIRVGVLLSGSSEQWSPFESELVAGLRERGYVEGTNLVLVRRYGELQLDKIKTAAAELAAMRLDVIVTSCTNTTRETMSVAPKTPIVMVGVADPVAVGLVRSLAHPGSNLTGLSGQLIDLEPKRIELLRSLVPEGSRIAVLMNGTNPLHEAHWQRADAAARTMKLTAVRVYAQGPSGLEAALEELSRAKVSALLVPSDDPMNIEFRERIAAAASSLRLPSVGSSRVFAYDGGLMSYGGDTGEGFRQSAAYVVKIANGETAANLPVEQPTRFPLVINLKTAATLGITIPNDLLLRADEIIR